MSVESKAVCVVCSSSNEASVPQIEAAETLGTLIGRKGHRLVYGGSASGLMGVVARATQAAGGQVTGIIPQQMVDLGLANQSDEDQIITRDIRSRKAMMEVNADAFIALPGGFGTLECLIEMISLRILGRHQKPIVLVNIDGFYNHLALFFQVIYREKFADPEAAQAYYLTPDPGSAVNYVERHKPGQRTPWP
ncbi:TIGR00730 family Rossman fold protein [Candidatus Sumerlaeota bacterium]|nr:TIGR00730 family Rossman fold protein [Candidatus Sumerlaeota bacterium]